MPFTGKVLLFENMIRYTYKTGAMRNKQQTKLIIVSNKGLVLSEGTFPSTVLKAFGINDE